MSEKFIREKLFKPFESTKSAGMGIGVFESREYVSELGGRWKSSAAPRMVRFSGSFCLFMKCGLPASRRQADLMNSRDRNTGNKGLDESG